MDEGIRAGLKGLDPAARRKALRGFGVGLGVLLWIFAALAWRKGSPKASWELAAGALSMLLGLAAPGAFAPLYAAWMPVALFLGRVNTKLLLGLLYYLVITPYGLALRLLGVKLLDETLRDADSYWQPKEPVADLKAYERQF